MESELNEDQTMIQQESVLENGAASVESSDDENISRVASKIDNYYKDGGDGTVGEMAIRVPLDMNTKFQLMRFRDDNNVDMLGNKNVRIRRENESEAVERPWLLKPGTKQSGTTFRGVKFNRTNKENYWMFVQAPGAEAT